MSDRGPADELRHRLGPIADQNPMAALWLARINLAEDPDEMARELMKTSTASPKSVLAALAPLRLFIEKWAELYAAGGAVEAEFHANESAS